MFTDATSNQTCIPVDFHPAGLSGKIVRERLDAVGHHPLHRHRWGEQFAVVVTRVDVRGDCGGEAQGCNLQAISFFVYRD